MDTSGSSGARTLLYGFRVQPALPALRNSPLFEKGRDITDALRGLSLSLPPPSSNPVLLHRLFPPGSFTHRPKE